jgi:hypothetical protein
MNDHTHFQNLNLTDGQLATRKLPLPVAERLERNPLSLAILSLIQLAMAPRLMVRSPKSLAVTLAE